jgi:hypothetical protein
MGASGDVVDDASFGWSDVSAAAAVASTTFRRLHAEVAP